MLLLGIAALAAYGFYASRGVEPSFGRRWIDLISAGSSSTSHLEIVKGTSLAPFRPR